MWSTPNKRERRYSVREYRLYVKGEEICNE